MQARQRVANAAVIEAETMLGYTQIRAPFEGVITRKLADVGDLATPGKPLLEMENPAALRLKPTCRSRVRHLKLGEKLPCVSPRSQRRWTESSARFRLPPIP